MHIATVEDTTAKRFKIAYDISGRLSEIYDLLKSDCSETKKRNAISKIKSLLEHCGPKYEYSAVISTYILYEDETFRELESYLRDNNLWDSEFEEIKTTLIEIAMPK